MASPKTPRAVSGFASDVRAGRYPRALMVAVACWLLLGVLLLISTLGTPNQSNQDRTTQDAVDALNTTQIMAPTGQSSWWFPYLPVLGAVVVIATAFLLFGKGWARIALAVLGLVAVVALAQSALWYAIPAGVLFVIGSVCGLFLSSHRYLTGRTGAAAPEGQTT